MNQEILMKQLGKSTTIEGVISSFNDTETQQPALLKKIGNISTCEEKNNHSSCTSTPVHKPPVVTLSNFLTITDELFHINFKVPVANDQELKDIEQKIKQNPSVLINKLSTLGGTSFRQRISLMIRKLLSKEMAMKFSAKGKKGKKDFSKTILHMVILEAARKTDPSESELAVTQMIGLSLASAQWRY